jgi:hypothetical protein
VRRNLLTAVSAAALSLSLLGAPALAQTQQLDDSVSIGLAELGIDTGGRVIRADQLAQIENVLASSETDEIKRAQIDEILGNEATATGRLGVDQLRDSVAADMAQLGMDTEVVGTLTADQLASIENVMASNETDEIKRARIEEILAGEATATGRLGVDQLRDSVKADMARLGVDAEAAESLTVAELAQLQNVLGSSDPDDEKRRRIEQILTE